MRWRYPERTFCFTGIRNALVASFASLVVIYLFSVFDLIALTLTGDPYAVNHPLVMLSL